MFGVTLLENFGVSVGSEFGVGSQENFGVSAGSRFWNRCRSTLDSVYAQCLESGGRKILESV